MKQSSNKAIKQSILRTLAYSQVFGWPLSKKEIFAKSQSSKLKNQNLAQIIKQLIKNKKIEYKNGYYFLSGNKVLAERRIQREKWAAEKFKIARRQANFCFFRRTTSSSPFSLSFNSRRAAGYLKIIPTILLVGVSGGLAVGNVDYKDDIDFFIICRSNSLWTCRFLAVLLLDFLGLRRRPKDKNFRDKICLNMFVDEAGLAVPENEHDLYTAHEVAQMKPLWDRGVYVSFLEENKWVIDYLPKSNVKIQKPKIQVKSKNFIILICYFAFRILIFALRLFEPFFSLIQKKYMVSNPTNEKIETHRLMFHPKDSRPEALKKYYKFVKLFKL